MDSVQFQNLVRQLATTKESEWLELKHNNTDPYEIGENISALSNAAALLEKRSAYILWGINDSTHELLGTEFRPRETKIKGQELESWLILHLDPQIDLRIHEGEVDGKYIVLFEFAPAAHRPIRFREIAYVRVGSYTKKLHDCPEKERALWRMFEQSSFENGLAMNSISGEGILSFIDCPAYFQLMKLSYPETRSIVLERLVSEKLIKKSGDDSYDITNVGAILFAKNLEDFDRLARKTLRIIFYRGDGRIDTIKEYEMKKGYALGFEESVSYINDQLPQNEHIGMAFRQAVRMYPEIAIRELVANALIHQDFTFIGAGPMVEIFANRIEISNPGLPLIDTLRFIDETPRSRNEILARIMRRLGLCEERGTGIDKTISQIELFQLPAPDFRETTQSTLAVLYGPRELKAMDSKERARAAYQHACLQYMIGKKMTNESLRNRLGIQQKSYSLAYRIIRDAMTANLVKPQGDEVGAGKGASYLPFWA
ncbi:MAG: putative DNA binding domain-containing protein [Verrucomicrobia bacterium]|nr:putative DNA binding domain-containing protein [Verrucomicrobiota bacterium]